MPLTGPIVAGLASMVQGPNSGKASTRALASAARWAGLRCSKADRKTKIVRFQTTKGASSPTPTAEGVSAACTSGRFWTASTVKAVTSRETRAANNDWRPFQDFSMATFRADSGIVLFGIVSSQSGPGRNCKNGQVQPNVVNYPRAFLVAAWHVSSPVLEPAIFISC